MIERHRSLIDQLSSFSRYLRSHNFSTGIDHITTGALALPHIDIGNRREYLDLIKIVFSSTPEEWENIEEYYREFIKEYERGINARLKNKKEKNPAAKRAKEAPYLYQLNRVKNWLYQNKGSEVGSAFYSNYASSGTFDLSTFSVEPTYELTDLMNRLFRRVEDRRRERRKKHTSRGEVNLRRLLKHRFMYGDELLKLPFTHRPKRRRKAILLCDVSRSMELYGEFFTYFIYCFQAYFDLQKVFVFNTSLFGLPDLQDWNWRSLKTILEEIPGLWGGGTKIGASLQELLHEAPRWMDAHTQIIVISDGWDTGDLDLLTESIYTLRNRVNKIVWFNPVLKNPQAREVSGMKAALPYIDWLAPLYNYESLRNLVIESFVSEIIDRNRDK